MVQIIVTSSFNLASVFIPEQNHCIYSNISAGLCPHSSDDLVYEQLLENYIALDYAIIALRWQPSWCYVSAHSFAIYYFRDGKGSEICSTKSLFVKKIP